MVKADHQSQNVQKINVNLESPKVTVKKLSTVTTMS